MGRLEEVRREIGSDKDRSRSASTVRSSRLCWCCAALLTAATFANRFQACFLFSVASYGSIFLNLLHRTESVMRASDFSDGLPHDQKLKRHSRSNEDLYHFSATEKMAPKKEKQKIVEWCGFGEEGELRRTDFSTPTFNGWTKGYAYNVTKNHPACKWFGMDTQGRPPPVAVIFSDRLVKSGMVTVTSLCRHPTPLYVLVLMQVTPTYVPIASKFLSCTILQMNLADSLEYLRSAGYFPDSICDGPGRDTLGKVKGQTFPILKKQERILFVDDDVVIQQDSAKLYNAPVPPGVVFTANCDVNLWNAGCQRFDAVYTPEGWRQVEQLLGEVSGNQASGQAPIKYDPKFFEWNFGFNLMSLKAQREANLTLIYQAMASQVLARKILRGDSLVYGLGVPFLIYQNRIECYKRTGWYVLDGLGYVPPAEMEVAGVTLDVIARAPVLHYNGERKPWGSNPFAEYVRAMGYWGQNVTGLPQKNSQSQDVTGDPQPMQLLVLLSGPRTGTEWLAKVMADDSGVVCGSIDDRTAPHPESLMPYDVDCDNRTQIPCLSWHIVGPKNESCDLRLMCQWRYVLAASRGTSVTPSTGLPTASAYEKAWYAWGKNLNATEIFEGYLRRQMRLPTTAPELPCRCEFKQRVLFLKFFLGWLERPKDFEVGLQIPDDYPYLRRYVLNGQIDDEWHSIDAKAVFEKLGAKIIYLYREPIAQYLSIQRGRQKELDAVPGVGAAWHCFEKNESLCPKAPKKKEDLLDVNLKDAGFFVIEALRLQTLARSFRPIFIRTFEACVNNATECINEIYSKAKAVAAKARRKAKQVGEWIKPNASERSNVSRGVARIREKIVRNGTSLPKLAPPPKVIRNIHRNRLAAMLISPSVLGSLSMICVIGSQPEPSTGTYKLRGQVSSGDEVWYASVPYEDKLLEEEFELPAVLRKIRQESRKLGVRRPQVVLYSNPRGSNPNGVDSCTSYRELEKVGREGGSALSWHEAGTLDTPVSADVSVLLLRKPKLLMSGRVVARLPACVVVPSHPTAVRHGASVCHVDVAEKPAAGWSKAERNTYYFQSLLRVGDEVMTVLNVSTAKDSRGDAACRVTVQRSTRSAASHEQGAHALAPTHLDASATEATCETPVQYALDYTDKAAAACIERHLEHALAVGADGTWLDNMGPNVYGAKTGTGLLLGSYDLRYPTDDAPEPCLSEITAANLEGPEPAKNDENAKLSREMAVYKFKLCRFSAMINAQASRTSAAIAAIHKMLGRRPLVYGNGLKHSFYWTGHEAMQVRTLYKQAVSLSSKDDPTELAPFAPNATENVIFYKVRGTRDMMSRPHGALDGFNMESFYGFIEVGHKCANWPTGKEVSREYCNAQLDHPQTHFWHANVRIFAHAAQRGLHALAKLGQAGWKTVGQEYLPPDELHRWVLAGYASFLLAVGRNNALTLGIHPFARAFSDGGGTVQPWIHPVFYLDLGMPNHTETLLEHYQVKGHSTYLRRFERGVVLYNPSATLDRAVPIGGAYTDPWDGACSKVRSWTIGANSGMVLVTVP
ncbi:putative galacturonosyltransferase 3-like protein [Chrysochromulina tobinii]|uniref:Putative galacturonosyltransferase 3-like protein n=1 Tax=Chrysochromulina tobinii TaxID=1460289 RepID=A0A0M0J959_9EUKA|nr:putative galacturonosyltransferase 3-like protein [Chrysochromulina tobinii]|eukprot:KOO23116.1 putative galacturonosyltransferase 3-like protein [Chrysochromulina sp. CCMP291]